MVPLTSTFPEHRLGVLGDAPKIACITCHQGVFKPLYGVSMAKNYPELSGGDHPIGGLAPANPNRRVTGAARGAARYVCIPAARDRRDARDSRADATAAALVAPH